MVIKIVCSYCEQTHFISGNSERYIEWDYEHNTMYDLLPILSADEIEFLNTGICMRCLMGDK